MRLKKFSASKVYGFLNFRLAFNDDLTFLIGVNGSGKTTALRLIHALLAPAFEELLSVPFEVLELTFEDQGVERTLRARKNDSELAIGVDHINRVLAIPAADMNVRRNSEQMEALRESMRVQCTGNLVYEFLLKLASPLFLGLDRRLLLGPEEERSSELDRIRMYGASRSPYDGKLVKGSLARSLLEVQTLLQEAYRRFRQVQDGYTSRLRKSVLLSAFKYTEFSPEDIQAVPTKKVQERLKLLARKAEIQQALQNIEVRGDEITRQLDEFFSKLENLFRQTDPDSEGFNIEWLTNKAQFERVVELVSLIDSNRASVEAVFAPVRHFIEAINAFYSDSRKEIEVDGVGALSVIKPDRTKASLEALSSGERQLIVIFGHLFFNKFGPKSNVFIIDEPELSLHLRWQELFVPKALASNPSAQLILATHSPEIVGEFKHKCVQIEITN